MYVDECRYASSSAVLVLELVRIERTFEAGIAPRDHFVGGLDNQGQIGLLRNLLLNGPIFIIDIVEAIDGLSAA